MSLDVRKAPQPNQLPATLLRLSARGLGDGRWWAPGPLTAGAILTRAGVPAPDRDQAGELASQVDGWAIRGRLPNPEGVAVRVRVSGESGPAFILDQRRGREGWQYRIFVGAAPSEGPQAPAAPPAAHLEARPAPARLPAPTRLRPERVVSSAERRIVDDDDRPVVTDPAQLRAEQPAGPAAPPPPPPPVAPPEADLLPAVEPGARDGAGVLPAAPAETDPDRIGVDLPDPDRIGESLIAAPPITLEATEQTPAAPKTPGGDTSAPGTEQTAEAAEPRRRRAPAKRQPQCAEPLCQNRRVRNLSVCRTHALAVIREVPAGFCAAHDCPREAKILGLCGRHYQQAWKKQRRVIGEGLEAPAPAEQARPAGPSAEPASAPSLRRPTKLDRAARALWQRLRLTPALGPWTAEDGQLVRRRLVDHQVIARAWPIGAPAVRWQHWGAEAQRPEGGELPVAGRLRGRAQAQVVVDALLRAAGWGLA